MENSTKKQIKLSKRETTVVQFMAAGMKNKTIAETLDINEKTVSTYILRLKKKLGLVNNDNSYIVVTTAIKKGFVTS
ncbi:response regulator transcription factor [Thalassobellus suaedae]|uniref:LuxR C-terminal-related transcriptional regulator n=1 Tax=Thalassobellus suaedae TaxID=3074124 RepID=A0ABY9XVU7_9FLAO|nr:LuxR C-terminal-related transcriptional regulator [Flavobacteriaceae bacterium HL-DH14]